MTRHVCTAVTTLREVIATFRGQCWANYTRAQLGRVRTTGLVMRCQTEDVPS